MKTIDKKIARLQAGIRTMGRVLVAFSGGVDSTLLLAIAIRELGRKNVLAVCAVSPLLPRRERQQAAALARLIGSRIMFIDCGEMKNPRFLKNQRLRCYWCKRGRFLSLKKIASRQGFAYVIDGANADDQFDYRPGMRAASELQVKSPLLDAGFSKKDIREFSRRLELPTWDKPAAACLASRIPCGTKIEEKLLLKIESAERRLHRAGFSQVRVRHHGDTARIEVPPKDIKRLFTSPLAAVVSQYMHRLGWRYITVDLDGYNPGSLNPT